MVHVYDIVQGLQLSQDLSQLIAMNKDRADQNLGESIRNSRSVAADTLEATKYENVHRI